MLPLKDDNPKYLTPVVTWTLMAVCVVVFLGQLALPPMEARRAVIGLGAIPRVLFQLENLPPRFAVLPAGLEYLTLVTSLFLHGGWAHLLGNLLYLWIFGDNVEDAMGHWRFLVFYLVCGVAANLVNAVADPASGLATIGASGAISGVLGAYLLLYPRARVVVWAFVFFIFRLPAWLVLGFWFLLQFVNLGSGGNIAWWAHIGGMVAGMALIPLFKYGHVGLFGSGHLEQTKPPGA